MVLKLETRLLFGPLSAAVFLFGTAGLALMLPGYSHVRQTISEIGELGSPGRVPFAIMLCCVAACLVLFASAVREIAAKAGRSQLTAHLIRLVALTSVGLAVFAFPYPLHNVFGLSATLGYQAPAAFAISWRNDPKVTNLVIFSWVCVLIFWIAAALNLAPNFSPQWAGVIRPYYGMAQRALFSAWFGWCAVAGLWLRRQTAGERIAIRANPM
jgi:hypothetical membrane protein